MTTRLHLEHLTGLPGWLQQQLLGKPYYLNRDGYIILYKNSCPLLFEWLREQRVFEWYSTNTGEFCISLHQIVVFFCCGGLKHLLRYNGKYTVEAGVHECHHINGVTTDNRPANLVLISTERHQTFLNKVQSGVDIKLQGRWFPTEASHEAPWEMTRQGRNVHNPHLWFANVLGQTLLHCINVVTKAKADGCIKTLQNWVEKYHLKLKQYWPHRKSTRLPEPDLQPYAEFINQPGNTRGTWLKHISWWEQKGIKGYTGPTISRIPRIKETRYAI